MNENQEYGTPNRSIKKQNKEQDTGSWNTKKEE